jgi:cell shape-determining protein MreD
MAILLAFPILGVLLILQSAIFSRILLLHGASDMILLAVIAWALQKRVQTAWHWSIIGGLLVSIVSALPLGIPILMYSLPVGVALILKRRVWQVPILAMFVTTFIGTVVSHAIELAALSLTGNPISIWQAINNISLPSLLMNLLVSIPAYALFNELAGWLYPEVLEV